MVFCLFDVTADEFEVINCGNLFGFDVNCLE